MGDMISPKMGSRSTLVPRIAARRKDIAVVGYVKRQCGRRRLKCLSALSWSCFALSSPVSVICSLCACSQRVRFVGLLSVLDVNDDDGVDECSCSQLRMPRRTVRGASTTLSAFALVKNAVIPCLTSASDEDAGGLGARWANCVSGQDMINVWRVSKESVVMCESMVDS